MTPNDLRSLVRCNHAELRRQVDALEEAARAALTAGADATGTLLRCARRLHASLREHTGFEDSLFAPLLESAEGDDADLVLRHHRRQREWLAEAIAAAVAHPGSAAELTRELRALAQVVLEQMLQEERALYAACFEAHAPEPRGRRPHLGQREPAVQAAPW